MKAFTASEWNDLVSRAREGQAPADRSSMLEFAAHNLRENFTSADDVVPPGREALEALLSVESATDPAIKVVTDKITKGKEDVKDAEKTLQDTAGLAKIVADKIGTGKKVVPAEFVKGVVAGVKDHVGDLGNMETQITGLAKKLALKISPIAASDSLSALALTPYRPILGQNLLVADVAPHYAFKASIVDIGQDKIVVVDRTNLCLREFRP